MESILDEIFDAIVLVEDFTFPTFREVWKRKGLRLLHVIPHLNKRLTFDEEPTLLLAGLFKYATDCCLCERALFISSGTLPTSYTNCKTFTPTSLSFTPCTLSMKRKCPRPSARFFSLWTFGPS